MTDQVTKKFPDIFIEMDGVTSRISMLEYDAVTLRGVTKYPLSVMYDIHGTTDHQLTLYEANGKYHTVGDLLRSGFKARLGQVGWPWNRYFATTMEDDIIEATKALRSFHWDVMSDIRKREIIFADATRNIPETGVTINNLIASQNDL